MFYKIYQVNCFQIPIKQERKGEKKGKERKGEEKERGRKKREFLLLNKMIKWGTLLLRLWKAMEIQKKRRNDGGPQEISRAQYKNSNLYFSMK